MLAHLGMIPLANRHSRLVKQQRSERRQRLVLRLSSYGPGPEKKQFGQVMSSWNRP